MRVSKLAPVRYTSGTAAASARLWWVGEVYPGCIGREAYRKVYIPSMVHREAYREVYIPSMVHREAYTRVHRKGYPPWYTGDTHHGTQRV